MSDCQQRSPVDVLRMAFAADSIVTQTHCAESAGFVQPCVLTGSRRHCCASIGSYLHHFTFKPG